MSKPQWDLDRELVREYRLARRANFQEKRLKKPTKEELKAEAKRFRAAEKALKKAQYEAEKKGNVLSYARLCEDDGWESYQVYTHPKIGRYIATHRLEPVLEEPQHLILTPIPDNAVVEKLNDSQSFVAFCEPDEGHSGFLTTSGYQWADRVVDIWVTVKFDKEATRNHYPEFLDAAAQAVIDNIYPSHG